jgi:peptide deformylase
MIDPGLLKVIHYPDPRLRKVAAPIPRITDEVRAVAARMIELMRLERGVGLAAPQVGLSWRLFVANPSGDPGDDRVFVNPVLGDAGQEVEPYEEGCLSLPDIRAQIRRPRRISVHALDLEGKPFTLVSDALPARVWQHETDHLDGVLILDRMTVMDKLANRRRLRELEEAFE